MPETRPSIKSMDDKMTSGELALRANEMRLFSDDLGLVGIGNMDDVNIKGKYIPPESENLLKYAFNGAKTKVARFLMDHGLQRYTSILRRDIPILVEDMSADEGLRYACTNGIRVKVNEEVIPETNAYVRLMDKLGKSRNPFSKYLYGQLTKPLVRLKETLTHELHHHYQFESGFIDDVFKATTEYVEKRLPEHVKMFAPYIASRLAVPMFEGMNEGATLESNGCRTAGQIKAAVSNAQTTYDAYTDMAIDAAGTTPGRFYRKYMEKPFETAREYVANFLNPGRSACYC
jgi:hypothetical protein